MITLNLKKKVDRKSKCFYLIKKTETECQELYGMVVGEYAICVYINVNDALKTYIGLEKTEVINNLIKNECTIHTFLQQYNKFIRLTTPGIKGSIHL